MKFLTVNMKTKSLIHALKKRLLLLSFISFIGLSLNAQNGLFDVRFTTKNYDCVNNKITIQVQVKSSDAAHAFLMGDANYRFEYNPTIVSNPTIASQENFSNTAPANDANYIAQNLNGSVANATQAVVSLNIIYGGAGTGAKSVGAEWMNVSCLSFDVIDPSKCIDLTWHNDTQFPITGMNEIILTGGGNYDQYEVGANGIFGNFNGCVPQLCNSITAIDDINSTLLNTSVSGNVSTNDNSTNGTKTYSVLNADVNGSFSLSNSGTYTYVPNNGFTGYNSVTYQVCNSLGQCDTARLVIAVTDIPSADKNSAPIALSDVAIAFENIATTGNVLNNDFDPDKNTLTVATTPIQNVKNGVLTLNSDGSYNYVSNIGYIGRDTFVYQVCDNGTPSACATAMVVIVILQDKNGSGNNAPVANDDAFVTYIEQTVNGNLKLNDSDPNSNTLTYNTTPLSNPAHGTVTINTNGTFAYTPTAGYYGADKFTYTVCDDGTPSICDVATVYLTVYPEPNVAAVVDETPQTSIGKNPINFCLNITDPNTRDIHTATLCNVSHGTVVANVNTSTRQLCITYTSDSTYNGQDTICVIICDNGIPSKCDTIKVPISVTNDLCIDLQLTVMLEGAFDSRTGKMKTILNSRGLLPGQTPVSPFAATTPAGQPFNRAPWNYTGTESMTNYAPTVVDWVLVSLRTDSVSASSTFLKTAALLHDDGHIQLLTSCNLLSNNAQYFVVIEHRNHLGVMSPQAVRVANNKLIFDFTVVNSYVLVNPPSSGQKLIGSKWTMYAGDGKKDNATANYDINFTDSQLWKLENGIFDQYLYGDFNMDADVNFRDQILWKNNNGKYSGVPH